MMTSNVSVSAFLKSKKGIEDGAVHSSTCFAVEKKYEIISTVDDNEHIIIMLPGRNVLFEHFTNGTLTVIDHDTVFPSVNHVNTTDWETGFFEYRIVSMGIKCHNVAANKNIAGKYEVFDMINDPSPNWYKSIDTETPANSGVFLSKISHNESYFDRFIGIQDLTQFQHYITGHIEELEGKEIHLQPKVNTHPFRCTCGSYGLHRSTDTGVTQHHLLPHASENRKFIFDMFDHSYLSKVIKFDLPINQHIVFDFVINYEILSDKVDVNRYKEYRYKQMLRPQDPRFNPLSPDRGRRPIPSGVSFSPGDDSDDGGGKSGNSTIGIKRIRGGHNDNSKWHKNTIEDIDMSNVGNFDNQKGNDEAFGEELGDAIYDIYEDQNFQKLREIGEDVAVIKTANRLAQNPKVKTWIENHPDSDIAKFFKEAEQANEDLPDFREHIENPLIVLDSAMHEFVGDEEDELHKYHANAQEAKVRDYIEAYKGGADVQLRYKDGTDVDMDELVRDMNPDRRLRYINQDDLNELHYKASLGDRRALRMLSLYTH